MVAAIASQIGAAIENARLVAQDAARQRLEHELELAHDLQMKLLPRPSLLGPDVDAAAECHPAETVGGDFYTFVRLSEGKVGVMIGDVSSHGFSAALVMALVLSAAAIHAVEEATPAGTVRRLFESVRDDLAETEMHLSLFYAVVDRVASTLQYANAGHPHAFRLPSSGPPERLAATSPPLGLAGAETIEGVTVPWHAGKDLLVLFSDGITDAQDEAGVRFGEDRVLALVADHRAEPSQHIVDAVLGASDGFQSGRRDDRTMLILRI